MTARGWLLGLAVLPLVACKATGKSEQPDADVQSWTLVEIEAELADNDARLANEGIVVAMASPAAVQGEPPPPIGPEVEPSGEGAGNEPTAEEPGVYEAGPQAPDPEPGATMPTPSVSPERYEVTAADSAIDAPSEPELRRHKRPRLSKRSARRDAEPPTRCERVCELAEATCELETQICELAERHPDEPRYEQACLRAEQQCAAASRACQSCVD